MTYNILAIGDIHGRDKWKDIIDSYSNERIDKIVFIGDYVDSFDISAEQQLMNLRELINFKLNNKQTVELLIGNHDIQYMVPTEYLNKVKCSGFQETHYSDYHNIFKNYKELFNIAFQHKNWLFSHAGIHRGWYNFTFKQFHQEGESLAESLNHQLKNTNEILFDCGFKRGGSQKVGGPLWADKSETLRKPLQGYHQVVGHTIIKDITKYNKSNDTSITYIDNQNIEKDSIKNGLLIKIEYNKLWETPKTKIKSLF